MEPGLYLRVAKDVPSDKGQLVFYCDYTRTYTHLRNSSQHRYCYDEWKGTFDFFPVEVTEYLVTKKVKAKL